ncbi:hypothetical protein ACFFSW_06170 [Saccharothrix longispora]|uniref:Membrane protein n=1 Tax=Saccharothrix longispora TaxID=33920 RepID=A0ABU1PTD7_9PSEU|nr:hypothetical protein [Saccharothrix longispora]MDR6593918.1 putative membrane protein [Saccharothrix longispora]
MTKLLLSLHVLAAIVAIGPVTVAASMFPAATRRALTTGEDRDVAVLRTLNRICRVYAALGIAVPLFGLFTASSLDVLGDAWLITSIALTAVAAGVLVLAVLPRQQAVLDGFGREPVAVDVKWPARLAMHTGLFNVLWAVVTVLMIVRPGSTTGA